MNLIIVWVGIIFCLTQSASLSGLNLACFSVSKLRLELEVEKGNENARKIMELREDSNFLLVTILWGNVAVNVLLALLSNSVLTGLLAFLFSTVVITILGEIIPQAYFSRNALKVGAKLTPLLKIYQIIFYLVAKPTAYFLDQWLGKEAISYLPEKDLEELVRLHIEASETEIEEVEGRGAMNFLNIDDLYAEEEGEPVDPKSIIQLRFEQGKPIFPDIKPSTSDKFLQKMQASRKKWVIIIDQHKQPKLAVNADRFIRDALFNQEYFQPTQYCHRPIIVRDEEISLGQLITRFKVKPEHSEDDVIDRDIILIWHEEKKVITGSDILGRLLRGIVQNIEFQE